MAVSHDQVSKEIWRFWVAIALYSICWLVTLLFGLRVFELPHINRIMFSLAIMGLLYGQLLESWMLGWTRPNKETKYSLIKSYSLASIYIVPIVLAVIAQTHGWAIWLSILSFLGLMVRVGWHFARRPTN